MGNKASSGLPKGVTKKNYDLRGFRVFSDRAVGSHEFSDDYRTQTDFFLQSSNYDALIRQMSSEERSTFDDWWCPGHFMDGQQYGGFSNMTPEEQRVTRIFDKYLDKSKLIEGLVVHRLSNAYLLNGGLSPNMSLQEVQNMIGTNILIKGNMSTSVASEGLTIGDRGKMFDYSITIPPSRGAGMWIGDGRINFWRGIQREFMTNRDIVVNLKGATQDSSGVIHVELEYIGREKHDYD